MREIASCCEGDYRVGPAPKTTNPPEFVLIATSAQYEQIKNQYNTQETEDGN